MKIVTIEISDHIHAQGVFIRLMPNGNVKIKDGKRFLIGKPLSKIKSERKILVHSKK